MRKTFKLFCAAALAVLAVSSCGKIWDEFDVVHGELDDLKAKVEALEERLNTEVAALNTKLGTLEAAYKAADADLLKKLQDGDAALAASIEALNTELDALDGVVDGYITSNDAALKAAIEDYKKADAALKDVDTELLAALAKVGVTEVKKDADGNVVITFNDEAKTQIVVAKYDSNANNTGLLTVVDGKWAVVGADGKTTVLDALVHPDTKLEFKVVENELYVSYDGKNWEKTGVVVDAKTAINVVTDVKYKEGDKFVTIVVGEAEYVLPFYAADNSSLTFGRTDAFFMYGASKKMELQTKDIEEYYVMSKPDGWKATMEGTTLTVTAPAKALIEIGAAELEGEVLVHATSVTGACKVLKLNVATGEAMKLSYADGNINFFTAYTSEQTNFWGETYYDFVQLFVGVTPLDEFLTYPTFESFIETMDSESALGNIISLAYGQGYIENGWYEEGVCEDITVSLPLNEIVNYYNEVLAETPIEYNEDEIYVVWVLPQGDSEDTPYFFDQALYTFTGTRIEFEATASVYNDVTFASNFIGADGYAVGAFSKSMFDSWVTPDDPEYTHEDALYEYLVGSWQPGPFGKFTSGNKTAMGDIYPSGEQNIKLADIMLSDPMAGVSGDVAPDTEYFVWVLPYFNEKPAADYTLKDLNLYTCKTAALVKNEDVNASVFIAPGYESVKYTITPPEDGNFSFSIMPVEEYEEEYFKDGVLDEKTLIASFAYGWPFEETITEDQTWDIETGTDYVLVTYSTANGYYSLATYEFTPLNFATPNRSQWMFKSEFFDLMTVGEPTGVDYCFDLGVSYPTNYPEIFADPNTAVIGMDYEIIGAPAGTWMPAFPSSGSYTITPTDDESGVIVWLGSEVPYSDFDGETCTFDLSLLLSMEPGEFLVEATLAEEPVSVQAQ